MGNVYLIDGVIDVKKTFLFKIINILFRAIGMYVSRMEC